MTPGRGFPRVCEWPTRHVAVVRMVPRFLAACRRSLSTHHGDNCGCSDRDPAAHPLRQRGPTRSPRPPSCFYCAIIARRLACRPCPARFTRESFVRTVCSQVAVGPVCHETSASRPSERTRRAKSIMPLNPSIGMCFVPVLVGEPRVAHKCEHFQPSLYGIRSRSEVV